MSYRNIAFWLIGASLSIATSCGGPLTGPIQTPMPMPPDALIQVCQLDDKLIVQIREQDAGNQDANGKPIYSKNLQDCAPRPESLQPEPTG